MNISTVPAHQVIDPSTVLDGRSRADVDGVDVDGVDVDGVVVIAVEGDVDLYSGPDLRQALADLLVPSDGAAGQGGLPGSVWAVVVDLSAVEFIDSFAVGVLVQGHHLARRTGCAYALVATHPMIHTLFEITGLARVLPLHPEVASAVVALRATRAATSTATTPVAATGDLPG